MTKLIYPLLLSILIISCENQSPSEQIEKLGGYWEIESVAMPDGTEKDFSISTTVDYIEVTDTSGIRTKVNPQLDGTFVTNGTTEKFELRIEEDSLRMYYSTPYNNWKETVLMAKDSVLKVKNRDGKIYSYKTFQKFRDFSEFR